MWNIYKSILYQTKRDLFVVVTAICVLFVPLIITVITVDPSELIGSYFFVQYSNYIVEIYMIVSFLIIARICGWDINDRTINYDVLAGHNRAHVYLGRVAASMTWAVALAVLSYAIPVGYACIRGGWGNSFPVESAITHFILFLLTFIRLCSVMVFFTFLLQHCYVTMLLGYVYCGISGAVPVLIAEYTGKKLFLVTATANMMSLVEDNYEPIKMNGEIVTVFKDSLTIDFTVKTILASIFVSVLFLIWGYVIFRKRDLK